MGNKDIEFVYLNVKLIDYIKIELFKLRYNEEYCYVLYCFFDIFIVVWSYIYKDL